MSGPLISVVVPTYNAAAYLPQTIESILDQSWPHVELIVVDDGSTDGTRQVLEPFASRLVYRYQPNSGGPARGRNVGIEMARGQWVALFDADDLMLPTKLEDQARVIERHGEIDLVFTGFRVIDEHGHTLEDDFVRRYSDFRALLEPTEDPRIGLTGGEGFYEALIAHNFIGTSSVLVRRDAVREVGGFDEGLTNGDDREMWYRLARGGKRFAFYDEVRHAYRKREGNITSSAWKRYPAMLEVLRRQRPHLRSAACRRLVDERIHELTLSYAWSLRRCGRYRDALAEYRRANAWRGSWVGYRGVARCLLGLATSNGR